MNTNQQNTHGRALGVEMNNGAQTFVGRTHENCVDLDKYGVKRCEMYNFIHCVTLIGVTFPENYSGCVGREELMASPAILDTYL